MAHEHEHHRCCCSHPQHALRLCARCNVVWCNICGQEWSKSPVWYYSWTGDTNTTAPAYGSVNANITTSTTQTCDHALG